MTVPERTRPAASPAKLRDVARLAGVSVATASRALNGKPTGRGSVEAVEAAARQLDYHPNRVARALATRSSDAIALLVGEPPRSLTEDPFFSRVFVAMAASLRPHGKQAVLLMTGDEDAPGRLPEFVRGGQLDGVVVTSQHGPELAVALASAGLASVFIGQPGVEGVPFVDVDNRLGGHMGAQHLLNLGCRCVATITGTMGVQAGRQRFEGYVTAMSGASRPLIYAHGDFTVAGGRAAMTDLLARRQDIDGVLVASDTMAIGAAMALQEAGRRVPDDVRLVTFDNSTTAQERGWTSVENPIEQLADVAVRTLMVPGTPLFTTLVPGLVIRESAR